FSLPRSDVRVAEGARLESVWGATPPGFESQSLRHFLYPQAAKDPMRRPSKRLLLARSTVALCLLGATLCGRFLYGIHAENAAMQWMALPGHELPAKGESVLVIAPHCDDETLGAGGMIAEATRRGARVTV